MATMQSAACRLREDFDSRETIRIEEGALRVRVFNIQADASERKTTADVEEIPTIGLGAGQPSIATDV